MSYAAETSVNTALINPHYHFLHLLLALPQQPNGTRRATHELRFAIAHEFACFGRGTGHQGMPMLIDDIHVHLAVGPPHGVRCPSRMLEWLGAACTPSAFAYP